MNDYVVPFCVLVVLLMFICSNAKPQHTEEVGPVTCAHCRHSQRYQNMPSEPTGYCYVMGEWRVDPVSGQRYCTRLVRCRKLNSDGKCSHFAPDAFVGARRTPPPDD